MTPSMRVLALSLLLMTTAASAAFTPSLTTETVTKTRSKRKVDCLYHDATWTRPSPIRLFMAANSNQDFYETLGVSWNSDAKEIKTVYRKLAKRYHPDVNPDEDTTEIFQQINSAYEVLMDPVLKKEYDRSRERSPKSSFRRRGGFSRGVGVGRRGVSRPHAESDGSVGSSPFGSEFGRHADTWKDDRASASSNRRTEPRHETRNDVGRQSEFAHESTSTSTRYTGPSVAGGDLRCDLGIDSNMGSFGGQKLIRILYWETCDMCSGGGVKPASTESICSACSGSGKALTGRPCPSCWATGIRVEAHCTSCQGKGSKRVDRQIMVRIPSGVETGRMLCVEKMGVAGRNGGVDGDLYVFINVREGAEGSATSSYESDHVIHAVVDENCALLGTYFD